MSNDGQAGGSQWIVLKTLRWTTDYFKQHGVATPRMDAEILLAHLLGCQRIDLYVRHDQPLNADELARFKQLIKRRIQSEPVAYIVGAKEFWSLPFEVASGVLIPRPDTECLVQAALNALSDQGASEPAAILELGVGSGAVVVALAHERPMCRFWGTDRSWIALRMARNNAVRNGVDNSITFFAAHWLESLGPGAAIFDMIVSNPPYIASADIPALAPDIRLFEPLGALDGGPDGMEHITTLISGAHGFLKPGGLLLLEIGFDQREAVQSVVQHRDEYDQLVFHKDDGGHDRVAQLRKREARG